MLKPAKDWNPLQSRLKELLKKRETFKEAMDLCLIMHSQLHFSNSYFTQLWEGLSEERFRRSTKQNFSIAWQIWHITRIEDITANILIDNSDQIFNTHWKKRLNVDITDTGNAMTNEEVDIFSYQINMEELNLYRRAVGEKTRAILQKLNYEDLKRKFSDRQIRRLKDEGSVVNNNESYFLIDFWGKMTVARVILLPITRHQVIHLNNSFKIKSRKT